MGKNPEIIDWLYRFFNERDIDSALALMCEDVRWPKASEGGSVSGKAEIRSYWSRQWLEFEPTVEPLGTEVVEGKLTVRVHQLVRSKAGALLSDSEVVHVYTIEEGLVKQMELGAGAAAIEAFRSYPR